jgi:hypothetical protein
MSTRFQPLQDTHVTCIGVQDHILFLEKIPGVNPVFQKKPEKDFMFHLTAGFPDPSERRMSVPAPNQKFIGLGRRVGASPRKGPEVWSYRMLKLRDQSLKQKELIMGFQREWKMKILNQLCIIENSFDSGIEV